MAEANEPGATSESATEPKPGESPEVKYGGTLPVTITNATDVKLTGVVVYHQWSGRSDQSDTVDLGPGESYTGWRIRVGSGGIDHWGLDAYSDRDGHLHRSDKQCSVYSNDFDSQQPIGFIFHPRSAGFSIQMPKSSSCWGNSYD